MSLKQFKMKQKNKKGGFFGMLLGALGALLLGNLLIGKGVTWVCEGTFRGGQNF